MSKFEIDKISMSRAEHLSSKLMHDLHRAIEEGAPPELQQELFSERRYAEYAEGVPISDVVVNIEKMATEFAMARHWDKSILCLKLNNGESVPIAISELWNMNIGAHLFPTGATGAIGSLPRIILSAFNTYWREEDQIIKINLHQAQEGVQQSLTKFLSYRIAGMKKWKEWVNEIGVSSSDEEGNGINPPPGVGKGGGLQVQVSCLTPGLRIHISPAYFVNYVYFGSPTSPVTNYVLPGCYIFAGDGPMLPKIKRDNGVFHVPPSYHLSLVKF